MTQMSKLKQLKSMTKVVADTGDIQAIEQFTPQDATTNPSLLLKAAQLSQYQPIIDNAIAIAKKKATTHDERLKIAADQFAVMIGTEILKIIKGRVSTEVNASLSFDTKATILAGRNLISAYEQAGVNKERILVKIASTWEGIQAAKVLEAEGIHCNLTLMFHFAQALACADAKVTLVSPFVGRIYDWYKKETGIDYTNENDPGVQSVKHIYHYYRKFDIKTIVMGASFRNVGQIEALSGCDYLTISPALLAALDDDSTLMSQALNVADAKSAPLQEQSIDEQLFRWQMNDSAMATEKLAQGIRLFNQDLLKLYEMLSKRIYRLPV